MTVVHFRVLTIVGGLLVAVALFLGQQQLEYGDRYCGSAFNPATTESSAVDSIVYGAGSSSGCRDATSERQTVAIFVGVVGAALLGGGLYGIRRQEHAAS